MFRFGDPNQYRCSVQFYDSIQIDDSTRFNSIQFDSIQFNSIRRSAAGSACAMPPKPSQPRAALRICLIDQSLRTIQKLYTYI